MLGGDVDVNGKEVRILGTFFSQPVDIPDEEGFETGQNGKPVLASDRPLAARACW